MKAKSNPFSQRDRNGVRDLIPRKVALYVLTIKKSFYHIQDLLIVRL